VTPNSTDKHWIDIDLHVHSIVSNRPKEFMLRKVQTGECYTQPEKIYEICRDRGMDLVTITDHDSIDGALQIAHLPGVFLSEEITAEFPEDGLNVHVVAWDITEAQHVEIQRTRENIYELARYLRSEQIPHYLAHPLSEVRRPITAWHIQRLLLMFKHLEGKNGTRDVIHGMALQRLVKGLSREHLVRWANLHNMEPVDWEPVRYLTGGSDDHGRLNIARAFTRFRAAEPTTQALRKAFFAGEIEMGGKWGTAHVLGHNIYSVTFQNFMRRNTRSAFTDILNLTGVKTPADALSPPTSGKEERRRQIVELVQKAVFSTPGFDPALISKLGHTDEGQDMMARLAREILNNLFKKFLGDLVEAVGAIDIEDGIDKVPGLLSAATLIIPYLFGYRFQVRDRNESERLVAELGFGWDRERKCKVAVFTDTGYEVNGVALGLRRMVTSLRELGHDVELVVCATPPEGHLPDRLEELGGLRRMEPMTEFNLPAYEEMRMGIPSFVDMMDYLASEDIGVIQVSTPGPLGLLAMVAGKLLGLPVVAHYHTELPDYALNLTQDRKIAAIVRGWTSWFYRQADRVVVPSRATAKSVKNLGVEPERIALLPRGVDTDLFTTDKRNHAEFERFGMNGARKLLYVGRVSREKGLDSLLSAFGRLRAARENVELVVVGDGPYKEDLQRQVQDENVVFVGYQRGEQLARIYASADVFVFPSTTDTFGNVVLEAQASGVPSVVANRGGPAEQVTPGVNGFVVDPDDSEQMARAIGDLLDDEGLRQDMGRAARRRALTLSLRQAAQTQWELYEEAWGRGEKASLLQWSDEDIAQFTSPRALFSLLS
jgi:glycosyltransferase involved in cell wall biosynthesis